MQGNVFVYGKLRVCVRGFSEGKSDVANVQRPLIKHNTSNFLYTVLANRYFYSITFSKFSSFSQQYPNSESQFNLNPLFDISPLYFN